MNDDQLHDELRRRSQAARFRAEDLLPGVRRATSSSSERPARFARWAPLAGLAAAAAIVIAVVVAFPRVLPSTPSTGNGELQTLTTQEFAADVRNGSLDGQTVLVDGAIMAYNGGSFFGGACDPNGPACLLGQLEGVDPRITIFGPEIRFSSPSDSAIAPPIRGTLLLSVNGNEVEYVGRAVPNGDQLTWSAAEARQLDVNTRALDDVVLIDGWITGLDFPAPCASLPATRPDLPVRHECGRQSWLSDQGTVMEPEQGGSPPSSLEVQPEAFADFAPDSAARTSDFLTPQRGVYGISRRLYGQFCEAGDASPCWDWWVVGRLSQTPPEQSVPSLGPIPTPQTAPTSTSKLGNHLTCGGDLAVALTDSTNLIQSCDTVSEFGSPIDRGIALSDGKIGIYWRNLAWWTDVSADFDATADGFELAINAAAPPQPPGAPSPAGPQLPMHLTLNLAARTNLPIRATVNGDELPQLETPSPTSIASEAAPPSEAGGTTDASRDFTLAITSPKTAYSADEAIDIQAALSYTGSGSSVTLSGSGSGLVAFGVQQLDGNIAIDGIWTADCKLGGYPIQAGTPLEVPFFKSGGFDANGLNADFYRRYFADPQLHLPPGRWKVYAVSDFTVGSTCSGDDVRLTASKEIDVTSAVPSD